MTMFVMVYFTSQPASNFHDWSWALICPLVISTIGREQFSVHQECPWHFREQKFITETFPWAKIAHEHISVSKNCSRTHFREQKWITIFVWIEKHGCHCISNPYSWAKIDHENISVSYLFIIRVTIGMALRHQILKIQKIHVLKTRKY
jgi:hypothetical protein